MHANYRIVAVALPALLLAGPALAQQPAPSDQTEPPATATESTSNAASKPATNDGAADTPPDDRDIAPTTKPVANPTTTPSPAPVTAAAVAAPSPSVTTSEKKPSPKQDEHRIFAEDWWHSAHALMELHGYFRTRAEFFHNFYLGRVDNPGNAIWPMPADNSYAGWSAGQVTHRDVLLCGDDPLHPDATPCNNKTQAGANMRFRLRPELHVSDNLRIVSQIDMLDNVVLGSTPDSYVNQPSSDGGYQRVMPSGYAPLSAMSENAEAPTAGVNSDRNSLVVKRVWGEYVTPIGELRFGRMPSHWGLGMMENAGDGFDDDYQTTRDRIMFTTGFKSLDLYVSGAWDFPNEGTINSGLGPFGGQPYDAAQLDDVDQYVFTVVRRKSPRLQKLALSRGKFVLNGGLYFAYRKQMLANDDLSNQAGSYLGASQDTVRQGFVRRNEQLFTPDIWLQVLYEGFRFELEAASHYGSLDTTSTTGRSNNYQNRTDPDQNGWKIREYGITTQTEYTTMEDRLHLNFGFGWASGDPDVAGGLAGGLKPIGGGLQEQQTNDRTYSTFRFNPNYKVDLIMFRHLLNRVQGTYYFRPSVAYDFSRNPNGQRIGGSAAAIWSRASEFVQAPGHKRDLGVELDLSVYFQSKDGSLNDDPTKMGGLYTMLQYGVLFPMGGMGYLPGEQDDAKAQGIQLDTSTAQTLRWYAGIFF